MQSLLSYLLTSVGVSPSSFHRRAAVPAWNWVTRTASQLGPAAPPTFSCTCRRNQASPEQLPLRLGRELEIKRKELPNPLMEIFANCPIRPSQPWENGFLAVAKCLLKIALDFFMY